MAKKILTYLAFLTDRLPSYFFPIFLLLVEWFLRSAFKLNTQEFIGPTLASAGAGMLITLTNFKDKSQKAVPENLPPDLKRFVTDNGYKLELAGIDKTRVFSNISWIFTFLLTLLWIWSITLSTQSPSLMLGAFPAHYYPGAASYLLGLMFSEIREAL